MATATLLDALSRLTAGVGASELESQTLEFKEEGESLKRTLESLADAVVCLANAEGGHVVVGVSDHPRNGTSLVGVGSDLTVHSVVRGIFDRTRPSLSVPVEEMQQIGVRLIVIVVPRGAALYSNAKGTSTRRVGAECRPFPPEDQKQALASRGLFDWSAETVVSLDEGVSPDELTRLRRLLRSAGHPTLADGGDTRLLSDLRLAVSHRLTRAGLLLVGRTAVIRRLIPTHEYAYQFRPSPGSEATAHFREAQPLLAGIERMLDASQARRATHPINVSGGVQLQLDDYPTSAVRELVVNAMVHRDFEIDGAVEVQHTPDVLSVNSPGGLVFGVTPSNILTHPSTPRNRLLLEVVTMLQLAERTGQGVDRVYREMLRAGKKPPHYADDGSSVAVSLVGGAGNDTFIRFVSSGLGPAMDSDLEVLLALDYLRNKRTLNAEALSPLIQRSGLDAQGTLDRMTHAGLIEPSRRSARQQFPRYALSAEALTGLGRSVTYHRRAADGIDDKIVDHVREYGFITNQTLRRLFDLGVYPARDLLRDLQTRGILIKLDEKSSGPGIRYGRGLQFPRDPRGRRSKTN